MRNARESLASEIDELDRLLALDPTNEEVVRRLMIALLHSQRRGEAMRVYRRLVIVLRDGYKREPSAETRVVYEALLSGEEVAGGDGGRSKGSDGRGDPRVPTPRPLHPRPYARGEER